MTDIAQKLMRQITMEKIDKEKCANCKWPYPHFILSGMTLFDRVTGRMITEPICGICALELGNEAMGVVRNRFEGPRAEEYRLTAIEWREEHPELKPD